MSLGIALLGLCDAYYDLSWIEFDEEGGDETAAEEDDDDVPLLDVTREEQQEPLPPDSTASAMVDDDADDGEEDVAPRLWGPPVLSIAISGTLLNRLKSIIIIVGVVAHQTGSVIPLPSPEPHVNHPLA